MRRKSDDELDPILVPDRRKKDGQSIFSLSKKKYVKIASESQMDDSDIAYSKSYSVLLRAAGYSVSYISDNLQIQQVVIKKWFAEESTKKQLAKIQKDMAEAAVDLLRGYAVEGVEMLMEIARTTIDHKVAIQAITEVLDRGGVTKVNKSESTTTQKKLHEHEISDEFFEKLEGLPLETQTRLAEMAKEMEEMISEAKGSG